jgi:hypothetical protein
MGVISITDLVPALISSRQKDYQYEIEIPIDNLLNVLQLTIVQGQLEEETFKGNICVFSDLTYYQQPQKTALLYAIRTNMELVLFFRSSLLILS